MTATTGIVKIGDYSGAATAGAGIDILVALLGSPDETRTGPRAAGSNLDEMSPIARAQLVVELNALKAVVGDFEAGT